MTAWMLAQLKPNADAIARRNLERQGFATFRPLERYTVVRGGRFVTQSRPFFPGYMFVQYPGDNAPWSLVNSTYGVARLVKFGERPAQVPEHVIAELRAVCDEHGIITLTSQLVRGTSVEIQSGAFTSFMGRIERVSPRDRALVLIDFMGTQTRVSITTANLRVASDRTSQARGIK